MTSTTIISKDGGLPTEINDGQVPSRSDSRDEENTLTLPSGRILGYARYGVRESRYPTTIYLHGFPACRLEAGLLAPALHDAGLQVVSIDRPGYGLSTPDASRKVIDHARDVLAIADHLKLERFAVLGISGGTPYAFACSQVIPEDRLIAIGIVSGMGPWDMAVSKDVWKDLQWLNKVGFLAPVYTPWLYSVIEKWLAKKMIRDLENTSYDEIINGKEFQKWAQADKDFFLKGGEAVFDNAIRMCKESTRQEDWAQSHLVDATLLGSKWGFDLQDVKTNVRLWYGDKDHSTPVALGRKIVEKLPQGELTTIEGGTHSSVVWDSARWIKELLGI